MTFFFKKKKTTEAKKTLFLEGKKKMSRRCAEHLVTYRPVICSLTGVALPNQIQRYPPLASSQCSVFGEHISSGSIQNFVDAMTFYGIRRGFMKTPLDGTGGPLSQVSHPLFEDFLECAKSVIRKGHESAFFEIGPRTQALLMVVLCNTARGSGSGGVRFTKYDSVGDQFIDTLRLAEGMSHKNALAGLWYGGGKGTISQKLSFCQENTANAAGGGCESFVWREKIFQDWGEFVSGLQGAYITAEDVGCTPKDMKIIHSKTRFVTCIPSNMGGSGNPSQMTARGVMCAIEAACCQLNKDIRCLKFGVQGLGNVGMFVVEELLKRDVKTIIATDTNKERVKLAIDQFFDEQKKPRKTQLIVGPEDQDGTTQPVLFEDIDVLVPCALGGILNPETIPKIRAKIICGAANNQLKDPQRDGKAIFLRGITYVPDFVANRMGIVNCADEHIGKIGEDRMTDPIIVKHLDRGKGSIFAQTKEILLQSMLGGRPTNEIAQEIADQFCLEQHPIFPGRARAIQLALVNEGKWLRDGQILRPML